MQPDISVTGLSRRALTRSLLFIEEHLDRSLLLEDIAGAACLSAGHFSRMFKISTGRTPMSYVRWRRVERAKALLMDETLSAAEIALELGFFDQSHFCRCFRAETGLTPRHFLKQAPDAAAESSLMTFFTAAA